MNQKQVDRVKKGKGFIAALDQSGGSTPKALAAYGIPQNSYSGEDQMFDLVHEMRRRIITAPAFSDKNLVGAILFEQTMDRTIEGKYTADYLWDVKGVVPFLKVDKGLTEEAEGVQLMKPIPDLDGLLDRAKERHIFGTKMRSVIMAANLGGIAKITAQQFEIGKQILAKGLIPILEPEVNISIPDKKEAEKILKAEILKHLESIADGQQIMLKLTLPTVTNFYKELVEHPKMMRVVALSGGYTQAQANELLAKNNGIIASFSRALSQDLRANQRDEEFNSILQKAMTEICEASLT